MKCQCCNKSVPDPCITVADAERCINNTGSVLKAAVLTFFIMLTSLTVYGQSCTVNYEWRTDKAGATTQQFIYPRRFSYTSDYVIIDTDSISIESVEVRGFSTLFTTGAGQYTFYTHGLYSVAWKPLIGETSLILFRFKD